jgi:hypothetical protein
MGNLVFAEVKPGVVNDIGEVELNIGNDNVSAEPAWGPR